MSQGSTSSARVWRLCPVCGTERGEPHLTKGSLRIVRCSRCGMLFANPVAEEYLTGSFYDAIAASFYLSPDKLHGDFAAVRFNRELRVFRRFCPGGEVLDVGCSTGAFLHRLGQKYGTAYRGMGIDVAGPALDHAESRGAAVVRAPFLEHDFGTTCFDAITFWAVLEHLAEPKRFLTQAAGLLRPGGHCFMLVPNMGSLAARWLGRRYRYLMPEHLNYFSRETLGRLVECEPRLKIQWMGSTHFNPVVIWQDRRRRAAEFVPAAERAQLLKRTNAWKQSVLLLPLRLVYGLTERLLGSAGLADNLILVARRE